MNTTTIAIVVLAAITFLLKGAGPLLPEVPDRLARRLAGLAPALLAALVYVELCDGGAFPEPGAKAAGVAAATFLAAIHAPFALCVVAGAGVAAALRAAGLP